MAYNVVGGFIWVVGIVTAGYLLGENKFIKDNFELACIGIVLFSLIPGLVTFLRHRYAKVAAPKEETAAS